MTSMTNTTRGLPVWRSRMRVVALIALPAASWAADLSSYRQVKLGTDLPGVARQIGVSPSAAKVTYTRPALVQELEWTPESPRLPVEADSTPLVALTFYNGELFRIAVTYDRYRTEGLTTADMIEAVSRLYGAPVTSTPAKAPPEAWVDREDVVARWQDPRYRFELMRSSYGPRFRLVGVLRELETPAVAAIVEGTRLDALEQPQRDAARAASEAEAERARLEKARLQNKAVFRP